MRAAKHANEVSRIGVTDALGDDVDALARMQQEPPGFGHPAGDDPLACASPGRLSQRGGEIGRAALQGGRHIARGDAPEAVALDEAQRIDDDTAPSCGARAVARRPLDFSQNERGQAPLDNLVGIARFQSIELAEERRSETRGARGEC